MYAGNPGGLSMAFPDDLPRDSFMNENFDDSYDNYDRYKDRPAGDSYVQNLEFNPSGYNTNQT